MNEGAGTKTVAAAADIVIRSVSTAIEMDIVESGTGRGSIGRGSGTRCEGMIGTETMVAPVAVVVGRCVWRGNSTRNIGGMMIGAVSSGAMMSVVTIEGVKRARLLVGEGAEAEAVEHRKTLAVAVRQRGGRRLLKGVFPCHSADARPLDGTSMCQGMSSILPCKQNKLVGERRHVPDSSDHNLQSTGLFNLPGANHTQVPLILGIPGLPPPIPIQTFGMGIGSNPNLSRQSWRLYISSITSDINEQNLADFFNSKMIEMSIGTGGPGKPVLTVQCNYEKNYAFVEVGDTVIWLNPVTLT